MWTDEAVHALERAVAAVPGGTTGDFAGHMRKEGVFVDRKTIGLMLRQLSQFVELGEGLDGWYLASQLEPEEEAETMSDEAWRASLDSVWRRDATAEELLRFIDEP